MRLKLWGVRGSIPVPGPGCDAYGGNTSCVQVTAGDGTELILDAGTGIRQLGPELVSSCANLHILLTHLHLDHIQGLMFFARFFNPATEITGWGPPAAGQKLRSRLARYISTPLSPIEIRELPAKVTFRDAPAEPWRIGGVEVRAGLVAHRGPTLGYCLTEDGQNLCYLPDHEPGLGQDLGRDPAAWISGHALACDSSLLIHDFQYSDEDYPGHLGWGHSWLSDALAFAHRSEAQRVLMFHHDPTHEDARLDELGREASARWTDLGGEPGSIEPAREGDEIEVGESAR